MLGKEVYIDGFLKSQLDNVKKRINQKDEDRFFIVDGREGRGKSVLVMQLASYCDPTFTLERVVFTADDFKEAIINAKKGQAVVFDEAFRGLSSKTSLSAVNKLLVQLMMECRQKNLIVFIVMPTFFLLERYVALFRATGLFHVYNSKNGQRGFWIYFNWQSKKKLYMNGKKKFWTYEYPKSDFKGKFTNTYVLDEEEYRKRKKKALEDSLYEEDFDKKDWQRNFCLWFLNKKTGMSMDKISEEFGRYGFKIAQQTISVAVNKLKNDKSFKYYNTNKE